MENQNTNSKNPIQVSERIFRAIEILAAQGPMGLLELSNALDLNKTTVHRILNSLICMDYARQDPDSLKYSLTYKFCSIATQILAQSSIIDLAHPHLKSLAEQTGETIHLVQLEKQNAVYIDKVEASQNSVRLVSMIGKKIPLYCSGVGKAMLADMPEDDVASIWSQSQIQSLTRYTITDYEQFRETLEETRQNGYALDNEENEIGVRCIAAALKNYNGKPAYALSVSAPKERFADERIPEMRDALLATKTAIEKEMGIAQA